MNLSSKDKILIKFKELLLRGITFDYFIIKKVIKRELLVLDNEKILDVGCGTGILSPLFAKASYKGIDTDGKLISYARENYKNSGLTYVDVPEIVGITGACENVDTLFKVGNRLDIPLFFKRLNPFISVFKSLIIGFNSDNSLIRPLISLG